MENPVTNRDIMAKLTDPPLPEWGTNRDPRVRAQVKSRFYYIFWGAATISVFAGQMYVGSGYRQMSESFNRIMDTLVIEIEGSLGEQRRFY